MRKKKQTYTPAQEARNKITQAKWRKDNPNYKKEWAKANPDYIQPSRIANPSYSKEQSKKFREENPNYTKEHNHKHDLGYWVVYLIHDFDGLGNIYCGQTQNIYMRIAKHKSDGRLNSDKYELIKQCETLKDALEFEAYMHEQGYHGSVSTEKGK